MSAAHAHAERVEAALSDAGLDLLIVADLVNPGDSSRAAQADVTWLSGFTGSSAVCVIGGGERLLYTDSRYTERAGREIAAAGSGFEAITVRGRLVGEPASRLHGRVGFDERKTSVAGLRRLEEFAPDGVELVAANELIGELRRQKDEMEVARITAASALADEVMATVTGAGVVGRTEAEVALTIEAAMREGGASGPSFETIVAAGENSALPHHVPGSRTITAGDVVLIDMGVLLDGYCSDSTRTFVTAAPDERFELVYATVLGAQVAALEAIGAGVEGQAIDEIARSLIGDAGFGEFFGHGLGHGVGIEIHEEPGLSPRSKDTLAVGDVVTVEPGIYLPGEFGVRIEDLVVVEESGIRNLSTLPKTLQTLSG